MGNGGIGKVFLYGAAEDFIKIIDEIKNTNNSGKINVFTNQENSNELLKKFNDFINIYDITLKYGVDFLQSVNKLLEKINPNELYIININWNKYFDGDGLINFLVTNKLINNNIIITIDLKMFLPIELYNIVMRFNQIEIIDCDNKYNWDSDSFKDERDYVDLLDTLYNILLNKNWIGRARIHRILSECIDINVDKEIMKKKLFHYLQQSISIANLICIIDQYNKSLYEYDNIKVYSRYINKLLELKKQTTDSIIDLPITNDISLVMINIDTLICDSTYNVIACVSKINLKKINIHQVKIKYFFIYFLSIYLTLERYIDSRNKIIASEKLNIVGQIASGVVHDINNILASILGQTQVLIEKLDDDELKKSVVSIQNSAKDGGVIVKRIMNFSKGDEQGFKILDVSEVVMSAVHITKPIWYSRAQILGKNIKVELKTEKGCYILGNEFEMRESIVNIILNASDAVGKEGYIIIKVYKRNNCVYIRISDNGKGMTNEIKAKIFNPFFSTKGKDGTGLGLSIVSETIKNMAGTIEVISKLDKGTEFVIKLPKVDYDVKEENEETRVFSFNKKLKIMVIDDQPEICAIVSEMLMMVINADVKRFCSSKEAICNIENNNFDMIITDLAMPGINGLEVIKRAKQIKKSIFIAVMTGWIGGIPKDEQGMADYVLNKPFTIEDIRNMIAAMENLNNSKTSEG